MKCPSIISCCAPTQMGDCICSLPAARYIKKAFPNSYSVAALDPRTRELAPLLLNHPDIDKIYITQKEEGYTESEREWVSSFGYNLPLFGHRVPPEWANTITWVEANFRLRFQFEPLGSVLSPDGWYTLTEEEKKPKLIPWFKIERFSKLIVISPFVGYSLSDKISQVRSPSLAWWKKTAEMLLKMGFSLAQIGTSNFPLICEHSNFYDRRDLSLLEATRLALGADVCLGAVGGMSFIINAYGQKTICLYTNWIKEARTEVLLPTNYKNNMIPVFGENGLDTITLEQIITAIKYFYE